jgi:hypothetical protein
MGSRKTVPRKSMKNDHLRLRDLNQDMKLMVSIRDLKLDLSLNLKSKVRCLTNLTPLTLNMKTRS